MTLLPCVIFWEFHNVALIFWFMIFELRFSDDMYNVRVQLCFVHVHIQFSCHHLLKKNEWPFPIEWFCLPWRKSFWPYVWVYFWALYSIPSVYIFVLMPGLHYFDYRSCVLSFEVRKCETSNFVLFFQHCFVYPESLEIPCGFYDAFFCLFKNTGVLTRITLTL